MKQPPTPPEPRKVRGDYKPVPPPTPPRVPASNPSITGRDRPSIPSSDPTIPNGGEDKVFDFLLYFALFIVVSAIFGVIFSIFCQ